MYIAPPTNLIFLFQDDARFWFFSIDLLKRIVVNIGIAQKAYDKSINKSKLVNMSSLGISSWKTKLKAISERKATIEVVNLASISLVGIHNTHKATTKINKTGIIILKI